MQFFPPIFCIYNVICPSFTRSRKSKATLKPGNQEKRLQSLKMAAKNTRVMPFFVENSLPVTLSREVSNANLSENKSQNRSRYLSGSISVGCYSKNIVWKGEKRCNILDTSSTMAGNRILVSLLFVKLETT